MSIGDKPISVDEKGRWKSIHTKGFLHCLVTVEPAGKANSVFLDKSHRCGLRVLDGNGQKDNFLFEIFPVKSFKYWRFSLAGKAPGSKKIDDHHFVFVFAQRKSPAIKQLQGKVACDLLLNGVFTTLDGWYQLNTEQQDQYTPHNGFFLLVISKIIQIPFLVSHSQNKQNSRCFDNIVQW